MMKKISINNLVIFRSKSDKTKKSFLNGLAKEKELKTDEGGGNYWIRSLSTLSNAFKNNTTQPIKEKISEILELFGPQLIKRTKDMYQRNLNILYNYEDFDFSKWLPENSVIISKSKRKSVFLIDTVPVQITPHQIYSFQRDGNDYVGAIWFVARLAGYKKEELGMFAEAMFIYLSSNFKQVVCAENCLIVDVLSKQEITYKMVATGKVPAILTYTINSVKDNL